MKYTAHALCFYSKSLGICQLRFVGWSSQVSDVNRSWPTTLKDEKRSCWLMAIHLLNGCEWEIQSWKKDGVVCGFEFIIHQRTRMEMPSEKDGEYEVITTGLMRIPDILPELGIQPSTAPKIRQDETRCGWTPFSSFIQWSWLKHRWFQHGKQWISQGFFWYFQSGHRRPLLGHVFEIMFEDDLDWEKPLGG